MDMPLLKTFTAIAEAGSVSRAAERLHLAQPSVSKRLHVLERQIGRPLFDRVGRRLLLTDAGQRFLPFALRALQELEDGRRALSHLSETVAGRLSLGTSHHIGLHRLPAVLRAYTERYPEVDLDLHFMDSEIACQAVLAGRLEMGIVTLPLQPLPNLETRLVWRDPLEVVVRPGHPLLRQRGLRLRSLAGYPAVLPDEATFTHRIVRSALEAHGVTPRVRLATNYLETLKMLVGVGLGWSVLPRSMLDSSLRPLRLSELRLQRELGAVWHRRRTLSAAAAALLQSLPGARG